jgi:hypothetical protein
MALPGRAEHSQRHTHFRELGCVRTECVILTRNPMNVIFDAPILSENAMRVITAATRLDDVRLGVIAQDPAEILVGVDVAQH